LDARILLGAAFGMLALQWAHAVSGFGGAGTSDFFGRWMYDAIVMACALAARACGVGRPGGRTWLWVGAGLLSKGVGDLIYSMTPNLNTVPVP